MIYTLSAKISCPIIIQTTCTDIYIQIRVGVCVWVYICIHICIYACIYVHMYTFMHMCICDPRNSKSTPHIFYFN